MPHLHRFFHATDTPDPSEATLSREESHHAMRVLRVRKGDSVELFDGRGNAWRGAILDVARNEVRVKLDETRFVPRPEPGVTLAQAWLHRDKILDDIVRQATVLGVARIAFFRADHSEKPPRVAEKWTRIATEACKQCGRLWLPDFVVFDSFAAVLEASAGACVALARMDGPHESFARTNTGEPVVYAVGPEGDFSESELALAQRAGALPVALGDYTLRSELAAIVGLTLIQHHLGHLGQP